MSTAVHTSSNRYRAQADRFGISYNNPMYKTAALLPIGRYVVAVSGGVDSVVLLDMLSKQANLDLVVAHFDHGTREDSAKDAKFVRERAEFYNLPFETQREELGSGVSEELARERRYVFLRLTAKKYQARIVTAHHADDAVETIAINFHRGTGWRGLAVLDSSDIHRPLLGMFKKEIIEYAKTNNLEWHEDSTNAEDDYLRNRIRRRIDLPNEVKLELLSLRAAQIELRSSIKKEISKYIKSDRIYDRYLFIMLDSSVAFEILKEATELRLTAPQIERALIAIKTAQPGTVHQAHKTVEFSFTSRHFAVQLIK